MKLIDVDRFLEDLNNECCDVVDADERYPAYSEYGYSYELIKQVLERRKPIYSEEIKVGYCPICDKAVAICTNHSMGNCPECGHDVALHKIEE